MKMRFVFFLAIGAFLFPAHAGAQDSSAEIIKQLARQEVTSTCKKCEISVNPKWIPSVVKNLAPQQITELQFTQVGLPKGYQTARVFYLENDEELSREIQLHIRIEKMLPVAARRIERNEIISEGDLAMRMTDITRLRQMPLDTKQKILNQSASGLIKKGNLIYTSNMYETPVIKAGDWVEMIYTEGGVEVALNCHAREDKAKGENIRLYSEKTRKTYLGKVITSGKVLWEKTL